MSWGEDSSVAVIFVPIFAMVCQLARLAAHVPFNVGTDGRTVSHSKCRDGHLK